MLETLITLLVVLLVLGLIYWVGHRVAAAFGLPAPIMVFFDVVLVVLFVLYLIRLFGLSDRVAL